MNTQIEIETSGHADGERKTPVSSDEQEKVQEQNFPGQGQILQSPDDLLFEASREALSQEIERLFGVITGQDLSSSRRVPSSANAIVSNALDEIEERIQNESWQPPGLLPLANADQFNSTWTWMGNTDRFELVKSLRRSVNRRGEELTDEELEYAVLQHEDIEELMQQGDFAEAAQALQLLLYIVPNDVLGNYKLALCILAVRGDSAAIRQASRLLHFAHGLEPDNRHLKANIDLILRICSRQPVREEHWKEDFPKSIGILQSLNFIIGGLHSDKKTEK